MAEKKSNSNKRKWRPVVLEDPSFFAGDMEGFVSLEVMEDYNLEELRGTDVEGPTRNKKAKEQPLMQV